VSTTNVCAVASKPLLKHCVAAATAPKPVIASALEKTYNGTLGAEPPPNPAQFADPALAAVAAQGLNPLETENPALSVRVGENEQESAEREAMLDAIMQSFR
jgi:hypothetical protein